MTEEDHKEGGREDGGKWIMTDELFQMNHGR